MPHTPQVSHHNFHHLLPLQKGALTTGLEGHAYPWPTSLGQCIFYYFFWNEEHLQNDDIKHFPLIKS